MLNNQSSEEFLQEHQIVEFSFDSNFSENICSHRSESSVHQPLEIFRSRCKCDIRIIQKFVAEIIDVGVFEFHRIVFAPKIDIEALLKVCNFIFEMFIVFYFAVEFVDERLNLCLHSHLNHQSVSFVLARLDNMTFTGSHEHRTCLGA